MKIQQDTIPLISVIIPVFNAGAHLSESLNSLLSQSYPNIEIIAIDDFSKDDSWKILRIYKSIDKRVRIWRNVKHYGKGITLNRALRKIKGQFVVFMDAEDRCYKDKLYKQLRFLQKHEKVVAVGTQCTFVDDDNKRLGASSFPGENDAIYHRPLHSVSIQFETLMINRFRLPKDLLKFSTQTTNFLYTDVLIKLMAYGQLINLPLTLQYHRKHTHKKAIELSQLPSLIQLGIKSIAQHDYRPSLRYIYNSLFKPNLSTQ